MTPSRIVEFLHEHHLAFSPNIKVYYSFYKQRLSSFSVNLILVYQVLYFCWAGKLPDGYFEIQKNYFQSTCKILDTISAMDSATSHWETRMRADDEYNSQVNLEMLFFLENNEFSDSGSHDNVSQLPAGRSKRLLVFTPLLCPSLN